MEEHSEPPGAAVSTPVQNSRYVPCSSHRCKQLQVSDPCVNEVSEGRVPEGGQSRSLLGGRKHMVQVVTQQLLIHYA